MAAKMTILNRRANCAVILANLRLHHFRPAGLSCKNSPQIVTEATMRIIDCKVCPLWSSSDENAC
jgi:hypothetical protein